MLFSPSFSIFLFSISFSIGMFLLHSSIIFSGSFSLSHSSPYLPLFVSFMFFMYSISFYGNTEELCATSGRFSKPI